MIDGDDDDGDDDGNDDGNDDDSDDNDSDDTDWFRWWWYNDTDDDGDDVLKWNDKMVMMRWLNASTQEWPNSWSKHFRLSPVISKPIDMSNKSLAYCHTVTFRQGIFDIFCFLVKFLSALWVDYFKAHIIHIVTSVNITCAAICWQTDCPHAHMVLYAHLYVDSQWFTDFLSFVSQLEVGLNLDIFGTRGMLDLINSISTF